MIQFPKNTHVTLPSVESWGTNMNILKDPPKSLFTKKKTNVFSDQKLTDLVEDSGDRICEMINVYARGTNPMVSVSYQNSKGSTSVGGSNVQASLPYKVNVDGAFRPPILTARDLLPLSRQPRAWTYAMARPGFADYSKIIENPNKFRQVKDEIMNVSVRPTAVFKLQTTLNPNYDIKNYVNDVKTYAVGSNVSSTNPNMMVNVEPCSGTRDKLLESSIIPNISSLGNTELTNLLPSMGIRSILDGNMQSNISNNKLMVESYNMEPKTRKLLEGIFTTNVSDKGNVQSANMEPKTKNVLEGNLTTNISQKITSLIDNDVNFRKDKYIQELQHTNRTSAPTSYLKNNLEDSKLSESKFIHDIDYISATSNLKGDNKYFVYEDDIDLELKTPVYNVVSNISESKYKKIEYENELQFDRNMPLANAHTNIGRNHENSMNSNSRDFNRLHSKVEHGSFNNQGVVPMFTPDREAKVYDDRIALKKKAYEFFSDRYESKNPIAIR